MAKYAQFTAILEKRIRRGDYAIGGLPTEQQLAEEIGVSRMTARRVLLQLMENGILIRKPHGRLEINRQDARQSSQLRLAFLAPAFSSPDFETWRFAVERSAQKLGAALRSVEFVHWDDPVISQTLTEFQGVFLVPSSEEIPGFVRERLSQSSNVVVLDGDLTDCGIPSVELVPAISIHRLGDHLYELGHRHIDCLNTQPRDAVIRKRIEQWMFWKKMHKVEGRVIDVPVEPYERPMPRAYSAINDLLNAGDFNATALVCITEPAITGAIRAFYEHKIQIGKEVSICALDGSGLARYQTPSRTVLESPDPAPYIEVCIEWLKKPSESWVGPLLVQPGRIPLYVGESTGPALKKRTAP